MTWLAAAVVTALVSAALGIFGAVFIWRGMPRDNQDGTLTMATRDRKTLMIVLLAPGFAALSAALSLVALATD